MQCVLILVVTGIFLPALQAFHFDRQPEDDTLDKWLQEQVAESETIPETV